MRRGQFAFFLAIAIAVCGAAWAGTSTSSFDDGTFGDFHLAGTISGQTTIQSGQAVITCSGWSAEGLEFGQLPVSGDFTFDMKFDIAKTIELSSPITGYPIEVYISMWAGSEQYLFFGVISSETVGSFTTVDPVNGTVASAETFDPSTTSVLNMHIARTSTNWVMSAQPDALDVITLVDITCGTGDLGQFQIPSLSASTNGSAVMDDFIMTGPDIADYPATETPEITCNVDPATIQSGNNVTLTAPEGSSYKWFKDGTEMEGETGQVLEFGSIQEGDAGVYTCEFNDGTGLVTTDPITLAVAAAPVGDLPVASLLGLGILAALCGSAGMRSLNRKK